MFFLFFITSILLLQCRSQEKQIRGIPEVDYPTYYAIPKTSFRCSDQPYKPGFYADTETRCQVFHYCYEHRQESFLCPMGTIFNQPLLACDYWYSSNCDLAPSYYKANAIKRNEYHFDEADYPVDMQSGNLYDKMAHLYETNKTTESPVLKNDPDTPGNELSRENNGSFEPVSEENEKAEDYDKYNYDKQLNMVEKKPEVVKYEVVGLDAINVHKGTENEQFYETDDVKNFILSEDGMLHPSQEDIYKMYPTDMNFNEGYSGYAEIPNEQNFDYDLKDFHSENDVQMSDFELQRRQSGTSDNYAGRRPSKRKPIIIPEEEPQIVRLPVVKQKRKPIGLSSAVGTNINGESSYETTYNPIIYDESTVDTNTNGEYSYETTYNPIIYGEETVSISNEDLKGTASEEFSLDETNSDRNVKLRDSESYQSQEEIQEESDSQLQHIDSSTVVYDSNSEKTRKAYFLSNNDKDEISSNIYESGSISNYGDESEIFNEDEEDSSESPDTTMDGGSSFDNDPFFGSGSNEHMFPSHSSDVLSFSEDKDIFSDSEDAEITDNENSYGIKTNISNAFEGSGIFDQETNSVHNFAVEVKESNQDYFEGNVKHGEESSFYPENFEEMLPSEDIDRAELDSDVGSGLREFDYLPLELEDSFDNSPEGYDKMEPNIEEINGSYYYVFSDSEDQSNYGFDDSSGFYAGSVDNVNAEHFESSDQTSEELIDSDGSRYILEGTKLKTGDISDDALHEVDYKDSTRYEDIHEKMPHELEEEISSDFPGDFVADDSNTNKQLTAEDLKFLKIMSENSVPMVKNLFEISGTPSSGSVKDEIPHIEIALTEQDINYQIHADPASLENAQEFENIFPNNSSDAKENSFDVELSGTEQKMEAEGSNMGSLDKDEAALPEENAKVFVSAKEIDPFSPLFTGSDEIDTSEIKQLSLQDSLIKPKNPPMSSVIRKDRKKSSRGRRLSENLRTFNPPKKDNPLISSSKDAFGEATLTGISAEILKMKHGTLKPYFYNYGSKNSGFNPRTGDQSKSSKLSKLTSLGKKLLAAKGSKFNTMKQYIDSYRNN